MAVILFWGDAGHTMIVNAAGGATGSVAESAAESAAESDDTESTMDEYGAEYPYAISHSHRITYARLAYHMGYTGKGVKVAVLSTGVNPSEAGMPSVTTISVGNLGTADDNGRGTETCLAIAGKGNGFNHCGMAPGAILYSVKVFDAKGKGDNKIIAQGIDAAVKAGVDIICLDGGDYNYDATLETAIFNAYYAGVAVFTAAGDNSSSSLLYPCRYKGSIPVTGLTNALTKMPEANYNAKVRYSAPGNSAKATAITVGCAAVLWNQINGTGKQKVDNLLRKMDSVTTKPSGTGLGKGIVNLAKALKLRDLKQAPAKPVFINKPGTYYASGVKIQFAPVEYGIRIYFTTDGTIPDITHYGQDDCSTQTYPREVRPTKGNRVVVKAVAYNSANGLKSPVVTANYTVIPPAYDIDIVPKDPATYDNIILLGESESFKVNFLPENAKKERIKWSIINGPSGYSNKTISINQSGVVRASKNAVVGTYTIQAETASGKKDTQEITVWRPVANPVVEAYAEQKSVTLYSNESVRIPVTIRRQDGYESTASTMYWNSSNPKVVTAHTDGYGIILYPTYTTSSGTAVITGRPEDGSKTPIKITVKVLPAPTLVKTITFMDGVTEQNSLPGQTIELKAEVKPVKATNKKLLWSVEPANSGVSVTKAGVVSIAEDTKVGDYKVYVRSEDGNAEAVRTIHVIEENKKATRLEVSVTDLVFSPAGWNASYGVTVDCDSTSWTAVSSNPALLQVEKGENGTYILPRVQGPDAKKGNVIISIYTTDGSNLRKTIQVTLTNLPSGFQVGAPSGRSEYLAEGSSMKLNTYIMTNMGNVSAKDKKIIWKSSDPERVSVDQKGNVTAHRGDERVVDITAEISGCMTYHFYVTPVAKVENFYMNTPEFKGESMAIHSKKTYSIYKNDALVQWQVGKKVNVKVSRDGLDAYLNANGNIEVIANKTGSYQVTLTSMENPKFKKVYTFRVTK